MFVPISWLREFTPYEGTAQALGDRLTMLGLELDGLINPFAAIKDIVVGYVAQCEPHPDSDHMHCCKVDIGASGLLDIVCGAPNVAAGQKVAIAPVGATLPDGLKIKKAKLRGQPSNGMICSERELGLSENHDGILILPDSLDVGSTLISALDLDTEVLDIAVTPNRPDCLSILGIARETAASFDLPLHLPELPLITDNSQDSFDIPIEIENSELCPLYAGRVLTGATAGKSPVRMRYRLFSVGIRAISNIVDVTNYIMIECGQPLHAFDLDKLAQKKIIVRNARQGEKLTTLDGKPRDLSVPDLCICDADKPVALAGVMGGENSEIGSATKNIFIESAVFDPRSIRKTSKRLGLQSEASYRFERGIDQQRCIWSLNRAAALMASICGGYVRPSLTVAEPGPFKPAHISFSPGYASKLLGVDIEPEFQKNTLAKLGCVVENANAGAWRVVQPSWRPDLTREADLVEEVGRVYGLDQIEPVLPAVQRQLNDNLSTSDAHAFQFMIKSWGAGLGLHEAINYSFTGQKDLDALGMPKENRLAIMNPLSEEQDVLRTCLAPGLLRDLANNLAYGAQGVRLFELASIFESDPASETGARETPSLGVLVSGPLHEKAWPKSDAEFNYSDIKGLFENLCSFLHLPRPDLLLEDKHPYLQPCVKIEFDGKVCGHMGRIKPAIAKTYNALKSVWLFECRLDILRALHEAAVVQFRSLPIYPASRRDITVIAPKQMHVSEIMEKIALVRVPLLEGAVLVDCFENPEANERNLTFRLTFRSSEKTLKDSEVDKEREKIADVLRREAGVKI